MAVEFSRSTYDESIPRQASSDDGAGSWIIPLTSLCSGNLEIVCDNSYLKPLSSHELPIIVRTFRVSKFQNIVNNAWLKDRVGAISNTRTLNLSVSAHI